MHVFGWQYQLIDKKRVYLIYKFETGKTMIEVILAFIGKVVLYGGDRQSTNVTGHRFGITSPALPSSTT